MWLYLIIFMAILINIYVEDIVYRALIGVFLICCTIIYYITLKKHKKSKFLKFFDTAEAELQLKNKNSIQRFPLPVLISTLDGQIISYNQLFNDICNVKEEDEELTKLLQSVLKNKGNMNENILETIQIKGSSYQVIGNYTNLSSSVIGEKYLATMYLIDKTKEIEFETKLKNSKLITAVIVIDNFEELTQGLEESIKPQILVEIDMKLSAWSGCTNGILKKFERDKYLFIFEQQYLPKFVEKKFDIIDTVKEINVGNKIPVTLSIGIGINNEEKETLFICFKKAMAAIDIGLGRGGDQVVINDGTKLEFYGGRTRDVEKKTRVKARVIAQGFGELLEQADKVIVMGHQKPDMDVIGAALGIYRISKEKGKNVYIVLNEVTALVKNLVDRIKTDEEYNTLFITNNEALNMITKDTLLVVVDTHRPTYTECPELLEFSQKIVVIDHHRKNADFINNAVLVFHETFASSACEMLTEMNYYLKAPFKLIEAEALYAGIVLDTKNFSVKTGARTFEAAAALKRVGVDTLSIKKMFQNDFEAMVTRSNVIKNAELMGNIAISVCESDDIKELQLVTAQSADELLEINGIEASFVLSKLNNEILISGRSMGSINVQVILEKLGGGGHITIAGAQIENKSIAEAKEMLQEKIKEYFAEQQ